MDRLRQTVQAATPGPWEHVRPRQDGTIHHVRETDGPSTRAVCRMEDTGYTRESSWAQREADARFIATFDPVMVSALLDVAEAANEIVSPAYLTDEGPYCQGVRVDDMRELRAALDHLDGATREDET